MIPYRSRVPAQLTIVCSLMAVLLSLTSCRKEKTPEPSNLDKNYFVIHDNPNDPIDHAIYEFYASTGIASFYTDTIYQKQVSREQENPPRYSYVKLALNYTPFGKTNLTYNRLSSRSDIPALLTLLKEDVIVKLPSLQMIPSILLLDSFMVHQFTDIRLSHGWASIYGFNTVGIKVEEVETMNWEERKMYASSILAGMAVNTISRQFATELTRDFFSISREATKSIIPINLYSGFPWIFLVSPNAVPEPRSIGLLFHPTYNLGGATFPSLPLEADDIRAFLTAVFRYTPEEFAGLHPNAPLVEKKFGIIRQLAKEAGFKLPG